MNHVIQDDVRLRAVEQIRQTLNRWDADPSTEDSIHGLRVCTKRLRAYLKVYPEPFDISVANRELKLLADSYAGVRDAQIAYRTLTSLVSGWSGKKRRKHREVIDFIAHQKQAMEKTLTPVEPHQAFERVLLAWPNPEQPEKITAICEEGMDRVYQKARRLGGKALKKDGDRDFHRWRKWVKYWLYCVTGLVEGKCPRRYKHRLKRLGDSLGVFHDICVLEENLKRPDVRNELGKQLKPFYKVIYLEKKRMKKSYQKAFKKLFRLSRKERNQMLRGT